MTHILHKKRIPRDLANKVTPINLTFLSHVHQAVSQHLESTIICILDCASSCGEQKRKVRRFLSFKEFLTFKRQTYYT